MHRDGKERRQIIKAMVQRQTRISKHPDQEALKRFKEVTYQLRYGKEKKDAK
jgi:hypothetical protein|nr:MAG TPA: hypothetical protein [Caudoviricetes sp.]